MKSYHNVGSIKVISNIIIRLNAKLGELEHKVGKLVLCSLFFSGTICAQVTSNQSQAEEGFKYTFNVIYLDYGKKSSSDLLIQSNFLPR